MTKDLTSGHPLRIIFNFAVPVFFGYLFQQFYNLVDTVIVGQFLGVSSLAAVGSTGSLHFLIIGFCMGLCAGFSIPVAQRFGAKDFSSMRKFVYNAAVLCVIFSIVLTALTVAFCRNILVLLQTPQDVLDMAYSYLVIIFAGIPVIIFYNVLAGIIRSVGDSKTPLYFLVISAMLNIFLDLFFIRVLKTGIPGAAYATVIAQGVSGISCFFYMRAKFDILILRKEDYRVEAKKMRALLGVGVPMGLQYSVTAVGSVILQSAVNVLGSIYVAAMSTGSKITMFFATPFDAMGTTMATYAGQNVGAAKIDRLNEGLFWCCFLGFAYSIVAFIGLYFFGENFAYFFMNRNESPEIVVEVAHNIKIYLFANTASYILLALVNIVRFMIQGMGFSKFAIFAGAFELIGRATIGILFVPVFGFAAVCFASPLAWVLADAFLIPAYFSSRNKLIKMLSGGKPIL